MKDSADNKTIDMLKPVPKTSAERQRAYRERKKLISSKDDSRKISRLDMYITAHANRQLDDILELHGNISKKELIEKLIGEEYHRLISGDVTR